MTMKHERINPEPGSSEDHAVQLAATVASNARIDGYERMTVFVQSLMAALPREHVGKIKLAASLWLGTYASEAAVNLAATSIAVMEHPGGEDTRQKLMQNGTPLRNFYLLAGGIAAAYAAAGIAQDSEHVVKAATTDALAVFILNGWEVPDDLPAEIRERHRKLVNPS